MNMILLNILIAVTGDVYDEYKEKAKIKLLISKVTWLWDQGTRLKHTTDEETEDVFLFVVEPVDNLSAEDAEWSGRIKEITRKNELVVKEMKQALSARFQKLKAQMESYTSRD